MASGALRSGFLNAEFLTQSYRVSAQVSVRNRRLSSILSDTYHLLLELYDVYVSRITQPGDIIATYHTASISKNNICCVVLPTRADGLAKDHAYLSSGKFIYQVFATILSFEIRGKVVLNSKLDVEALLAAGSDRFIPVMDATASVSFYPKITFSGPVILVNREQINLFCAGEAV
jgi:hypothetical protein